MPIETHTLHNMIHRDSGNDSEICPVCNGSISLSDTEALEAKCNTIFRKRKGMGITDTMYSERAKGIKASESLYVHPVYEFGEKEEMPTEIMLVPTGKWNTKKYGEVEVTPEMAKQMEKHFNDGVRKGVMIDVDHGTSSHGDAAAGWIKKVEAKAGGLFATTLEWTSLGKQLVTDKIYKFLSPEFDLVHIVPDDADKILENVLVATSLVNRPLLHDIPALSFSENKDLTDTSGNVIVYVDEVKKASFNEKHMPNLNDILAKTKDERTEEENTFVTEHKDEMSADQLKAEGLEATPEEVKPDAPADTPPVDTGVSAKEDEKDTVTMTASEKDKLTEDAAKGRLAFAAMERAELTENFAKMQFSEDGGKFAPALLNPIVEFASGLSDAQRVSFSEIISKLPDRKLFGEYGLEEDTTAAQANDAITAEVTKHATDNTMSFSEALKSMSKSDPTKFANYRKNLIK